MTNNLQKLKKHAMRISLVGVFIHCLSLNMLLASGSEAQKPLSVKEVKTDVNVKNASVIQVFTKLEGQTEFKFTYDYTTLSENPARISISGGERTVEEILLKLSYEADLHFKQVNNNISVTPRKARFIKRIEIAIDGIQISGKVTSSEDDEGIPGVSIMVQNTPGGAVTDVNGAYSVEVPDKNSVLVFSAIGLITQEVLVGNRDIIDVVMEPDVATLEEVTVIGYGTQRKSDLTGSVASAPLENFLEAPNTNILQALSGTMPGVTVGQAQFAGGEPDIRIRGRSTISGEESPLVVLDGVIYRGRIADINPRDIESVNVLKDASSKAIYGAQAANGVILITTKKGRTARSPSINYSTYYTTQEPSNKLSSHDREGFLKKARDVVWFTQDSEADPAVTGPYLQPGYTEANPAWDDGIHIPWTEEAMKGYNNGTDFNWYDEMTNPGYITDHQLSIQGGASRVNYFISGGYTKQEGWVLNDQYNRKSVRINLDTDVTDWLSIGANTFGSFSDLSGKSPNLLNLPIMSPLAPPKDENGDFVINPSGGNVVNPFLAAMDDDLDKINNLTAVFFSDLKIPGIEGLNYRVNYSHSYRTRQQYNSDIYGASRTGSASKRNSAVYDVMLDNIVSYRREIGGVHNLDFTFLYGWNKVSGEGTVAEGTNFPNLDLSYHNIGAALTQRVSSSAWEERFLYQMGRVNYGYRNKYLVTATLRRDGFSGFSAKNKMALFPSVGLGWVLSEESFLANSSLISFLKLRASYGVTGNLSGRYSSLARVSDSRNSSYKNDKQDPEYVFGDGGTTVNGQYIQRLSNRELGWEKTSGINIGLDFTLLKGKLSGNLEYYKSTTTDLLWNEVLPVITGFPDITSNIGKIQNTGLEAALNANLVQSGAFSWNLGFNISSNKNEIVELLGYDNDGDGVEDDLIGEGLFIGESIGSIYDYEVLGIWQIDDEIPEGYFPGSYIIADLNGDGEITAADDRKILGRAEPAYSFGVQNTLSYRSFTFSFFVKSVQGGNNGYMRANAPWSSTYGTTSLAQNNNWYKEIDYWSPTNPDGIYRLPGRDAPINGVRYFQRDFIRLQDISLAFRLNEKTIQRLGLNNLKVFVSGKNLLTITDWQGWDPETGQGFQRSQNGAPLMKGYSVGIDITL